jgi:tRNA (guanine-N7-)-methyltransferase
LTVGSPSRLPLEQLQPNLYEPPEVPIQIDWAQLFGNDRPVEIEVGFGKGLFLLTSSQQRPEVNFFGVEIDRKYQMFTANRLAKRHLANVRVACADARRFFQSFIAAESVRAVHVYFPDPWWKKRHHKRRLFTADFALACHRVLEVGGQLLVMTDVEEYFGIITGLLTDEALWSTGSAPRQEGEFRTNFERKYRLAGKPVFGASYEKRARTVIP